MVLCVGATEGLTGSGSGLKHLRRWGQPLRVSSILDRYGISDICLLSYFNLCLNFLTI